MPYITSVERIGLQQGLQQGRAEGLREGLLAAISLGLELKFGNGSGTVLEEIRQIEDLSVIQAIYDQIKTAQSLAELRRIYSNAI